MFIVGSPVDNPSYVNPGVNNHPTTPMFCWYLRSAPERIALEEGASVLQRPRFPHDEVGGWPECNNKIINPVDYLNAWRVARDWLEPGELWKAHQQGPASPAQSKCPKAASVSRLMYACSRSAQCAERNDAMKPWRGSPWSAAQCSPAADSRGRGACRLECDRLTFQLQRLTTQKVPLMGKML